MGPVRGGFKKRKQIQAAEAKISLFLFPVQVKNAKTIFKTLLFWQKPDEPNELCLFLSTNIQWFHYKSFRYGECQSPAPYHFQAGNFDQNLRLPCGRIVFRVLLMDTFYSQNPEHKGDAGATHSVETQNKSRTVVWKLQEDQRNDFPSAKIKASLQNVMCVCVCVNIPASLGSPSINTCTLQHVSCWYIRLSVKSMKFLIIKPWAWVIWAFVPWAFFIAYSVAVWFLFNEIESLFFFYFLMCVTFINRLDFVHVACCALCVWAHSSWTSWL